MASEDLRFRQDSLTLEDAYKEFPKNITTLSFREKQLLLEEFAKAARNSKLDDLIKFLATHKSDPIPKEVLAKVNAVMGSAVHDLIQEKDPKIILRESKNLAQIREILPSGVQGNLGIALNYQMRRSQGARNLESFDTMLDCLVFALKENEKQSEKIITDTLIKIYNNIFAKTFDATILHKLIRTKQLTGSTLFLEMYNYDLAQTSQITPVEITTKINSFIEELNREQKALEAKKIKQLTLISAIKELEAKKQKQPSEREEKFDPDKHSNEVIFDKFKALSEAAIQGYVQNEFFQQLKDIDIKNYQTIPAQLNEMIQLIPRPIRNYFTNELAQLNLAIQIKQRLNETGAINNENLRLSEKEIIEYASNEKATDRETVSLPLQFREIYAQTRTKLKNKTPESPKPLVALEMTKPK